MDDLFFDQWREFREISRQAEALLDSFLKRLAGPERPPVAFVPQCDVSRTPQEYVFRMALPGVLEEDIDLTIECRIIVVRGEREDPLTAWGGELLNREIHDGYFERRFALPFVVEPERVKVQFSEGILLVRIERPEVSA